MIDDGIKENTSGATADHLPLVQSTSSSAAISSTVALTQQKKPKMISLQLDGGKCCAGRTKTYATSFFRQWYLLTLRSMLCFRRDRSLALMRFIIHLCIGLLVGTLYFNIGNNAAMMLNNFRYIFLSLMFLMFTAFSSMTIVCKYCAVVFYLIVSSKT